MKKIAVFALLFLLTAYLSVWGYSYYWLTREIDRVYDQDATFRGVTFLGQKPVLRGFPLVPEIYYGGGLRIDDTLITFPEARLRGYPVPGLPFSIETPRGIAIENAREGIELSLDSASVLITVPQKIPTDHTHARLHHWQQSGGEIVVRRYEITKGALIGEGDGLARLDDRLQPHIEFVAQARGYQPFIQSLMQEGIIKPMEAMAATGLLNSLAQPDGDTGENIVRVSLRVQNQTLSVGPLQLVQLPEIHWPHE